MIKSAARAASRDSQGSLAVPARPLATLQIQRGWASSRLDHGLKVQLPSPSNSLYSQLLPALAAKQY